MQVVPRSCGQDHLSKFYFNDLSTMSYEMHRLTGISYAGIASGKKQKRIRNTDHFLYIECNHPGGIAKIPPNYAKR